MGPTKEQRAVSAAIRATQHEDQYIAMGLRKQVTKLETQLAELRDENARLKDDRVYCYDLEKQVKAAEAKIARVAKVRDSLATQRLNDHAVEQLDEALSD